jgi:glucokinase
MTYILIADIGGTNARFARVDAQGIQGIQDVKFLKVADYETIIDAANEYLKNVSDKPKEAVFAIAAPTQPKQNSFKLTNNHWKFLKGKVCKDLSLEKLSVVNDFAAMARGVLTLKESEYTQIHGPNKTTIAKGNIAVIGPGTGLGMASLIWPDNSNRYITNSCEGGHTDPQIITQRQLAIVECLKAHKFGKKKYRHISNERVCSGKGLVNLYNAICILDNVQNENLQGEDIFERAKNNTCKVSVECIGLMLTFLGAAARNFALSVNSCEGVYLVGDMLPSWGTQTILESNLIKQFIGAGGPRQKDMKQMPLYLVNNPFLPLQGLRNIALGV